MWRPQFTINICKRFKISTNINSLGRTSFILCIKYNQIYVSSSCLEFVLITVWYVTKWLTKEEYYFDCHFCIVIEVITGSSFKAGTEICSIFLQRHPKLVIGSCKFHQSLLDSQSWMSHFTVLVPTFNHQLGQSRQNL